MKFPTKMYLNGDLIDGQRATWLAGGDRPPDLPHEGIGQLCNDHDYAYLALNDYLILMRITRALIA